MCKIRNFFRIFIVALSLLILSSEGYALQMVQARELSQIRQYSLLTSGYGLWGNLLKVNAPILSILPDPNAPQEDFIWVNYLKMNDYPDYKRITSGVHDNGRQMYVCRGQMSNGMHPGKLYGNKCFVPWDGKENTLSKFQVLLAKTTTTVQWANIFALSAIYIMKNGIVGGNNNSEPLYMCRLSLKDGQHSGKYLISSNLCYVAWGGKEITANNGFFVLIRHGK